MAKTLKNFEESRIGTVVSFSEFLTNPNLDVIYATEKITHRIDGVGFGKSYFSFIYDKVTKQYCILSYAAKSSKESAYGISFESWWNHCIAVETVHDIIRLDQKLTRRNKLHNSRFCAQQTSIVLTLMRFQSIARSMKYLYSILNKNKKKISHGSENGMKFNKPTNYGGSVETVFYDRTVKNIPVKWIDKAEYRVNTYGVASTTFGDNKVVLFHDSKNIGIVDRNVILVVNELHFNRPIIRFKNKILKFFTRKVGGVSAQTVDNVTTEKLENIKGA